MTLRSRIRIKPMTAILSCGLVLAGCQSGDMDDLRSYVAEVKKAKGGPVAPLPEVKPYERYLYKSAEANARDPFAQLFTMPKAITAEDSKNDPRKSKYAEEIQTHNPEELEAHELDSLRMVGTLNNDNQLWGVVLDHDGMVHRVSVGNYMGKNFGKIINIVDDRIELREIISDGQGSYEERQASVGLADAAASAVKTP